MASIPVFTASVAAVVGAALWAAVGSSRAAIVKNVHDIAGRNLQGLESSRVPAACGRSTLALPLPP
ncbi:MAG: hypothetical protein JXP34_27240, partial [Planctomycetes bacterium]|nr:hypothetical protein [Planctomycetota bacterium]